MPQVVVNSSNIDTFIFSASFDLYSKLLRFSSANSTYPSGGQLGVQGISFYVEDSEGIILKDFDFGSPDIQPALGQSSYNLDMSSFGLPFVLGNTFKIIGGIKDQDGTIHYTTAVLVTVCKPPNITEAGYVPGTFIIMADCPNNVLTIKELSLLVYDGKQPSLVTKSGTLNYPTGTIGPVGFDGTPFTNNEIYTGQYRINCTTSATYDLGNDIFVIVTYLTAQVFDITCGYKMMDLICCLADIEKTAITNCDNAKGVAAKQQMQDVSFYFMMGLAKEINGQDASAEAEYIRKRLNCNCGTKVLGQNEQTPINPSVTAIVLQGAGGTTVPSPSVNGSTKTYSIASNIYQVVKGNPADNAWSIAIDTSTQYIVKYKITFNYSVMAGYILTAIQNDSSLLALLNSLITSISPSLAGLDGKCVVDLTTADYAISETVTINTLVMSVVINATSYVAPANLHATDTAGIMTWLNGLGLGTFNAAVVGSTLTIISTANTNKVSTITFALPNETKLFGSTSKTLIQVLQAIIDYMCALTACQVALCRTLNLSYFDYNGNIITVALTNVNTQDDFDAAVANSINNIVQRINTLTGITCDKLKAVFVDRPSSLFSGNGRLYGVDADGNCTGFSPEQVAQGVIDAVNAFANVKSAFCAIDCTTPATCPDVSAINANIISGNIGIYGVSFTAVPNANQVLTVRYRVNGTSTWTIATNALNVFPNGNVSGTSPYQITGLTAGVTYDINVYNNCGGVGTIQQITTPTTTVYTGTFLLDSTLYTICGQTPVTLYSSSPFGSGTTMYTDIALTTPVTGFTLISSTTGGNIFAINSGTGVVGIDTGSSCSNGVAGSYKVGNNTATICAVAPVTYYTNGAFAIGGVLYADGALTTPVTGFSYVVPLADNIIYNLNSATGVIGASTGLSCSQKNVFVVNSTGTSIQIVTNFGTYNFGPGVNGNIGVSGGGFVQNNLGTHQYQFLTSMPSTVDPDESPNPDNLGPGGSHTLNANVSNLNYIIVT